jgi:hypothetical protein
MACQRRISATQNYPTIVSLACTTWRSSVQRLYRIAHNQSPNNPSETFSHFFMTATGCSPIVREKGYLALKVAKAERP